MGRRRCRTAARGPRGCCGDAYHRTRHDNNERQEQLEPTRTTAVSLLTMLLRDWTTTRRLCVSNERRPIERTVVPSRRCFARRCTSACKKRVSTECQPTATNGSQSIQRAIACENSRTKRTFEDGQPTATNGSQRPTARPIQPVVPPSSCHPFWPSFRRRLPAAPRRHRPRKKKNDAPSRCS